MLASLLLTACRVQEVSAWPPAAPLPAAVEEAGELPASVTARPAGAGRWLCTIRCAAPAGASRVALAGSFNEWNGEAHPLRRTGAREWSVEIELDGGVHAYKFLVDGADWLADPRNPEGAPDGYGGRNSLLHLGRLARLHSSDGRLADGRIDAAALRHDPARSFYRQPAAGGGALLRLHALAHDVEEVELAVRGRAAIPMTLVTEGPLLATWEARVALPAGEADYAFVLRDGDLQACVPVTYTMTLEKVERAFRAPEWCKHAIWYQIMLDRFRNGDPSNDPDNVRPWTSEWFGMSPWEGENGQSFYRYAVYRRHYGGDLRGLEQQLDYLEDLGVNALYLTPIFKADSHHKYNATSFLHVDDHFGVKWDYAAAERREDLLDPSTWTWTETDRMFLELLRKAKDRGFRVIVDGVFNHVGTAHPAFADLRHHGAKSRYADWFDVTSWKPFQYKGWAGFGELPVFRKSETGFASAAVRDHVFAVTRRWMDPDGDGDPSDGVDGWRLDVPNEVPMPFWREWRELVKSINPDAYLCGELWGRADAWLDGRTFDAVMNYQFARTVVAWVGNRKEKLSAGECERRLAELRLAYPMEANYALLNLVDSHDTDRLVSMMHNPDREYDRMNRPQDDNPVYNNQKPEEDCYRRARLVALLQMTYLGAPMVYYGDEVGMWGADDPTNRKPMLWRDLEPYEAPHENFVMSDHLAHYRKVIALRRAHSALRIGTFRSLLADDARDLWAFLREDDRERLLVVLNASGAAQSVALAELEPAPHGWTASYGAAAAVQDVAGRLAIEIPALDGVVLCARK